MTETSTAPGSRREHLDGRSLRQHAARGVLITSGFTMGVSLVSLVRGFSLAAFLTAADYGVWGTVLVVFMAVLLLKQVGIADRYVQQDEPDQEGAFQKAFTLEVGFAVLLTAVAVGAAPLVALAYGEDRLLPAMLVFAATLPAAPLQMPIVAYYRSMRYARQATLQAVEPVVMTVTSLALAVAGAGYWALFGGLVAGAWASAAVAVAVSPYKLRLRYEPGTLRSYWSFSWPLFLSATGGVAIAVASVVAANVHLGLAGAGVVTLTANIAAFTQRVDTVVTGTLYPAICAAAGRLDTLRESFLKSNRLALMWAMPFGFGLTLFADDLVRFVLGPERWQPAVVVLQVYGVVAAVSHIGFNWSAYYRARGETRPLAVVTLLTAVCFVAVAVPLLFAYDLPGFAVGVGVQALVNLVLRAYYLGRLFEGFAFLSHMVRAMLPVLPATAVIVVLRVVGPDRTLGVALAELALFAALSVAATWVLERPLLREAVGYLRPRAAVA